MKTLSQIVKESNKKNPEKYVLVTREFGEPIYLGPLDNRMHYTPVFEATEAKTWDYIDTQRTGVVEMARISAGLKGIQFEKI